MKTQYEIQAENEKYQNEAIKGKKWKIKVSLCQGGDLGFKIFSPSGLTAQAFIFPDGRLSEWGINSNIEFMSSHLKFTKSMVDRLKKAGDTFINEILPKKYPEYKEMGQYSL